MPRPARRFAAVCDATNAMAVLVHGTNVTGGVVIDGGGIQDCEFAIPGLGFPTYRRVRRRQHQRRLDRDEPAHVLVRYVPQHDQRRRARHEQLVRRPRRQRDSDQHDPRTVGVHRQHPGRAARRLRGIRQHRERSQSRRVQRTRHRALRREVCSDDHTVGKSGGVPRGRLRREVEAEHLDRVAAADLVDLVLREILHDLLRDLLGVRPRESLCG